MLGDCDTLMLSESLNHLTMGVGVPMATQSSMTVERGSTKSSPMGGVSRIGGEAP